MIIDKKTSRTYYMYKTKELYTIQADNENKLLTFTILTPKYTEEFKAEYRELSYPIKIDNKTLYNLELLREGDNLSIFPPLSLILNYPEGVNKELTEIDVNTFNRFVEEILIDL